VYRGPAATEAALSEQSSELSSSSDRKPGSRRAPAAGVVAQDPSTDPLPGSVPSSAAPSSLLRPSAPDPCAAAGAASKVPRGASARHDCLEPTEPAPASAPTPAPGAATQVVAASDPVPLEGKLDAAPPKPASSPKPGKRKGSG